jgi:hypothetical protein
MGHRSSFELLGISYIGTDRPRDFQKENKGGKRDEEGRLGYCLCLFITLQKGKNWVEATRLFVSNVQREILWERNFAFPGFLLESSVPRHMKYRKSI